MNDTTGCVSDAQGAQRWQKYARTCTRTTDLDVTYKVFPPVVILGKGDKLEVVNTVAASTHS